MEALLLIEVLQDYTQDESNHISDVNIIQGISKRLYDDVMCDLKDDRKYKP